MLGVNRDNNEQLLISVLGTIGTTFVDLLSLQQTITDKQMKRIRVKKEGRNVQTENLSQIAVDSLEGLLNILMLANYLKSIHFQKTGERFQADVFQLSIGQMSSEKDHIEQIVRKYNFVRVCNDSSVMASLGGCLKQITDGYLKVSSRNSKLTFFLEDCLNKNSHIHLIYEIDTESTLKSQINVLSFGSYINRPIILKKNYIGNRDVIDRLKEYGNELTLQKLMTLDNREQNERLVRKTKLGRKYNIHINRSLLSETTSSLYKRHSTTERISKLPPAMTSHERQHTPSRKVISQMSQRSRYVHLRKIYKDIGP